MNNKINAYGLTGNMGCGKSTVAKLLEKRKNICVLDCDQISKEIFFDIKNRPKIEKILGKKVDEAEIIFKDPTKKQRIEKFIHPKVWQKVREEIKNGSKNTIFIIESALIYETKMESNFKGIILVTCNKKEQFKRIKERNNWTEKQIKERLKSQMSDKNKKKNVFIKINTNCSMKELKSKVEKICF